MRLVTVNVHGRFARWMRSGATSREGFTLPVPFFGAVIFFWLLDDQAEPAHVVYVHEVIGHGAQLSRWGWWGFVLRWLWGARLGWRNNPVEVEARRVAGQQQP